MASIVVEEGISDFSITMVEADLSDIVLTRPDFRAAVGPFVVISMLDQFTIRG